MTLLRSITAGKGVGDKLTSAEINSVDSQIEGALDKRAGQGDVFASVVQATGAGRLAGSIATGPDRDWTFHFNGNGASASSACLVRIPTLTAARSYSLVNSGATGGDRIFFYAEGTGVTPSGYADVKNAQGTGLFRLGWTHGASGIGQSLEAESDAAEFLFNPVGSGTWVLCHGAGPGMRSAQFTGTTTWVCPRGVYEILLIGYGAGGGGGGGGQGTLSSASRGGGGGGGGGGSIQSTVRIPVVPGVSYTITIGAGGAGGAGKTYDNTYVGGSGGGGGGDTTFSVTATGEVLARFRGAGGGGGGVMLNWNSNIMGVAPGGSPLGQGMTAPTGSAIGSGPHSLLPRWHDSQGRGGDGIVGLATLTVDFFQRVFGAPNLSYTGGSPASGWFHPSGIGGHELTRPGGWGGGGGAGPGGDGALGGAGGTGSVGNAGQDGATGASAGNNTGAGGGGGGGGGGSDFDPGDGRAGGNGGGGKAWVVFFK